MSYQLESQFPELLELARGEFHEDSDCPCDDTCRCENIAKLNAEFKTIETLLNQKESPDWWITEIPGYESAVWGNRVGSYGTKSDMDAYLKLNKTAVAYPVKRIS